MVLLISILMLTAVVALVLLIVAGIKAGHEKGGEEEKVIKNIYLYLVLFATLMMTIGGSVGVFMAAADIISPAPYYQSFAEYKSHVNEKMPNPEGQGEVKLSDEELLSRYNAIVSAESENQILRAKNSLLKSLGWIIIPLPVFLYFQRRLAKGSIREE